MGNDFSIMRLSKVLTPLAKKRYSGGNKGEVSSL